jgi:hypothetical protein
VSGDLPIVGSPETRAVCVQVVFHVADDRQGQAVTAKMIDRAHEIANLPECECDVDVSVETALPGESPTAVGSSGAPPYGRASSS